MSSRCAVIKKNIYRLMVNNIVVALVGTNAVGTRFQQIDLILYRRVFNAFKSIPDIERPSVGVIDIDAFCGIKAFVNKGTDGLSMSGMLLKALKTRR